MLGQAIRGLVSGVWGTIGMAGISFTLRRLVEPDKPIGKTHYESVVEWATGDTEMEPASRIRLGEATHFGFGAFWGLVFALMMRRRQIRPLAHGSMAGVSLWLAAFGAYMPALGISKSLGEMGNYERGRTLASHLVFAITTFAFLKALQRESDS